MTHMPNIMPDGRSASAANGLGSSRPTPPAVLPSRRDLRIASPLSEMAARILRQDGGRPLRTLMVAGAARRVGTSLIASGLAKTLSGDHGRVLLIEVTRDPPVPDQVDGLMILPQPAAAETGVWRRRLSGSALMAVLLPCSDAFTELSRQLLDRFDHVIWDMPPPLTSPVTTIAGALMDGTILVLQAGRTRSDVAKQATGRLRDNQARLLGVAFNRVHSYVPRWLRPSP